MFVGYLCKQGLFLLEFFWKVLKYCSEGWREDSSKFCDKIAEIIESNGKWNNGPSSSLDKLRSIWSLV